MRVINIEADVFTMTLNEITKEMAEGNYADKWNFYNGMLKGYANCGVITPDEHSKLFTYLASLYEARQETPTE